ncbi:hypothetical protein ES708_33824 [subsurface metagenome]
MRRANIAFGEWLSRPDWQWYTTHTFRGNYVSLKASDGHWQSWLNTLTQACKVKGLERPFYFRVTEYQDRGVLHYHSLIGGVGDIRRLLFKDFWELYGFARVEKYIPARGANFYVGKYLTKGNGEIRFSHNLTKHLQGNKMTGASLGHNAKLALVTEVCKEAKIALTGHYGTESGVCQALNGDKMVKTSKVDQPY